MRRAKSRPADTRDANRDVVVAAVLSLSAAAVVLIVHNFVEPFRFLALALVVALGGVFVGTAAFFAILRSPRRAAHPRSVEPHATLVSSDAAVAASLPYEVDLRTTATILRFLGGATALVCVPVAVRASFLWWPRPAAWLFALAALLSALQAWACFAIARRLASPTRTTYWIAVVLLCIELPAFPLTLLAAQGLYYLHRGNRSALRRALR